jgi:hypothetical protein
VARFNAFFVESSAAPHSKLAAKTDAANFLMRFIIIKKKGPAYYGRPF